METAHHKAPRAGLGTLRTQTKVTVPNGMVFHCIDHREVEGLYREIYEEAIYCQHGLKLSEGMVVFDVGANIGMTAAYLAGSFPSAKIFSFEPLPPTFEVLKRNIADHKLTNVKAFDFGLSDAAGTADFTFYPYSAGWSTMYPNHSPGFIKLIKKDIRSYDRLPWLLKKLFSMPILGDALVNLIVYFKMKHQKFTCQLKTVSEMIRETGVTRIDLLKVDVERSELRVLKGISDADWPIVQQVVLEVQNDADPTTEMEVVQLLKEKGFDVIQENARFLIQENGKSVNSSVYASRPGIKAL
jgi:FkbM family methyltransferase